VVVVVVSAQGCRTVGGLLRGDLRASDIIRDVQGIARISKAAQEANRAITPEDEYYLGRAVAVNVLSRYEYGYLGYDGLGEGGYIPPGITHYVYNIGSVLAAAAEMSYVQGDRPPPLAGYHFAIVDTPEINAFAAPGGYIFITAGMLRLAGNEDDLAAILAHEMAHVVRGHGVRVIKKARRMRVYKMMASEAAAGAFGDYNAAAQFLTQAVSDIIGTLVTSGYSRKLELEADWRAVRILAAAGYDPRGLYRILSVMNRLRLGTNAGFFSTHPPPAARMKSLTRYLPKRRVVPPPVRVVRFKKAVAPLKTG
jgi:predicted Zn-dependent protease